MKKSLLFVLLIVGGWQLCIAQNPGEWMWIHGDSIPNSQEVYGTQGVSSPANTPHSAYESVQWTDKNGNFWLFGGGPSAGADLWKYNPAINEWTWMKGSTTSFGIQGVSSPTNNPPNKMFGAAAWVDKQGNFWLFGGFSGSDDLWKFNPSNNEWVWIKGSQSGGIANHGVKGIPSPSNTPGERTECVVAWTDNSNNLWLFGGEWTTGFYNDLWKYSIATNEWTWMKGSNKTGQYGIYGSLGIEDSANNPHLRGAYAHWKDNNGNLWLFGGTMEFHVPYSAYNDLWRYNPITNNWTWMGGRKGYGSDLGSHGVKCISSPSNWPSQRFETRASWTDACGNFWMCGGGEGISFANTWNDLWMYSLVKNQWTWISGDSLANSTPNWGVQGISSPTNKMNGRGGNVAWVDSSGHIYLFGGYSTNATGGPYNDLWKYTIDTNCIKWNCSQGILPVTIFISSDTTFCNESGGCIDFTDQSTNNPTNWKWIFTGAVPDTSTLQNPTNICYSTPGTYAVKLIVSNSAGSDSLTVSSMITFATSAAAPVLSFSGDTIYCSNAAAYQWYLNGSPILNATDSFYVITGDGVYAVNITDDNGCTRLSEGFPVAVNELSGVGGVRIYPNPAASKLWVVSDPARAGWVGGRAMIEIYDVIGELILQSEIKNPKSEIDISSLRKGIYFIRINGSAGAVRLVKID